MKKKLTAFLSVFLVFGFIINVIAEDDIPTLTLTIDGIPSSLKAGDTVPSNQTISVNGTGLENYFEYTYADIEFSELFEDEYGPYWQTTNTIENDKTYKLEITYSFSNYRGREFYVNANYGNIEGVSIEKVPCVYPTSLDDSQPLDCCGVIISKTYTVKKEEQPQPSEQPKQENSIPVNNSYDDGSPYTYDNCGSVFDRWGNMIYQGNGCIVEDTYTIVNTADKN